ncbi:hypothetical protein ElyMa_004155200 [Elysia marginata]|uniref:Ig-like domain-containing protein n=1 Tax=Elysia marginata TaxID=1093978 RepID=A0AAV4GG32_9GAST|nr:hypothetical protein ElyMa_004155200 [Elysia marginata]
MLEGVRYQLSWSSISHYCQSAWAALQASVLPSCNEYIPNLRKWDIKFSGAPTPFTGLSRGMKIELTINDAKCGDAGIYECAVVYTDENSLSGSASGQQNISSKAAVQDMFMSLEPYDQNNRYTTGTNLTLRCVVIGSQNLQLSWLYAESNNPRALSPVSVEPDPLMTRALKRECDSVEFRSHLSLQLTEEDNGRMYICSARDGNEPEYRANETLSISAASGFVFIFIITEHVSLKLFEKGFLWWFSYFLFCCEC